MYKARNSWLNEAISCDCRNSSATRISDASDVSLTRLMKVFDNGGTDTRAACGRMIRRSDWLCDIPIMCAASHCPFGTDWIAARITSAAYPPTLRENAMIALGHGLIVTPIDGSPKKITKSWTSRGVPRITDT